MLLGCGMSLQCECGYDLRGLTSDSCPECGRPCDSPVSRSGPTAFSWAAKAARLPSKAALPARVFFAIPFGWTVDSLVGRVPVLILAFYGAVCIGYLDFIPPGQFFVACSVMFFVGLGLILFYNLTLLGLSVLFLYTGRLWLLIPVVLVQAFVARLFSGTIFGIHS